MYDIFQIGYVRRLPVTTVQEFKFGVIFSNKVQV
jgi:hypothetical protein